MNSSPSQPKEELWILVLYVVGEHHPQSVAIYSNLKRICEEHLPGMYSLTVVDLSVRPEEAAQVSIPAVPSLIRKSPRPQRTVIGDLTDADRVLVSLGIQATPV